MTTDGGEPTPFDPPRRRPPPPPPPPPITSDRWPTVEDPAGAWWSGDPTADAGPFVVHGPDDTVAQPDTSIRRRRTGLVSEDTFEVVRRHLARCALASAVALAPATVVFLGWASLRFALDDRSYGDSLVRSLRQFWFVLVVFMLTIAPAAYVLIRDGAHRSVALVRSDRYRRLLIVVLVVMPVAAAVIAFVVGHLLLVALVLVALLVLLALNGGF
jgi:hypothetical protein